MRIPDVQARLAAIAGDLDRMSHMTHELGRLGRLSHELIRLTHELCRRPPQCRPARESAAMTNALTRRARELHRAHPTWSQARIARALRVNPGRISEALRGKRK